MPHQPTIVCAVDGSPESGHLVRIGARLAEALGASLECVHVLSGQSAVAPAGATRVWSDPDEDDEEAAARGMLDGICDAAGATQAVRRVVRYGDPARRIAAIAEERDALLILVGTRGDADAPDAVLGSVSRRLAADAPCAVLVVAPHLAPSVRPERWPARTLVCGIDGSEPGWSAACHAATMATRLGGALMLVSIGSSAHALDDDRVRRLQAGREALDVHRDIRSGDPAWELERVAAAITAPVIAIGSRGLGPLDDGLLGSVARRVLRGARRPILIFPATSLLDAGA